MEHEEQKLLSEHTLDQEQNGPASLKDKFIDNEIMSVNNKRIET